MQSTSQESITFACPACRTTLQVNAELAGQSGPCPVCGVTITAPGPEQNYIATQRQTEVEPEREHPLPSARAHSSWEDDEPAPPARAAPRPESRPEQRPVYPAPKSFGDREEEPPLPWHDQEPYKAEPFPSEASRDNTHLPEEDEAEPRPERPLYPWQQYAAEEEPQSLPRPDYPWQEYTSGESAQLSAPSPHPRAPEVTEEDSNWGDSGLLVDESLIHEEEMDSSSEAADQPGSSRNRPLTAQGPLISGKARQTGFPVGWAVVIFLVFGGLGYFIIHVLLMDSADRAVALASVPPAPDSGEELKVTPVEQGNEEKAADDSPALEPEVSSAPEENAKSATPQPVAGATLPPNPLMLKGENALPEPDGASPGQETEEIADSTEEKAAPAPDEAPSPAPIRANPITTPAPAPLSASGGMSGQPGEEGDSLSGRLDGPRNAIQHFLQAENWEERLQWIYRAGELRDQIRDYYETHPDEPIMDYRLDFFHNEEQEELGRVVYVFYLTLPSAREGFPVIVLNEGDEYRLKWDTFIEFQDQEFRKFVENREKGQKVYRVVVQRGTYWEPDREEIPDVESLVCYRIDPPYPGAERQFAFVKADSEAGKALVEQMSWDTPPLAAQVELEWKQFDNGKPWLAINRLVSRSWVNSGQENQ